MQETSIKYGLNKVLLPIIMLTLIGFQIYTKSFYLHSHKLQDGKIISHAHPYSRSTDNTPYKHHSHSKAEYFFLCNIDLLFPLSFIFLIVIQFGWQTILLYCYSKIFQIISLFLNTGRSPPPQCV